jgi:hypothetical protein
VGKWENVTEVGTHFDPRYGFKLSNTVVGTFLCKSEAIDGDESLVVKVIDSQINSSTLEHVTVLIRTPLQLKCQSVKLRHEIQRLSHSDFVDFSGAVFSNITSRDIEWTTLFEMIADRHTRISLKCKDEEERTIWWKEIEFVGKLNKVTNLTSLKFLMSVVNIRYSLFDYSSPSAQFRSKEGTDPMPVRAFRV